MNINDSSANPVQDTRKPRSDELEYKMPLMGDIVIYTENSEESYPAIVLRVTSDDTGACLLKLFGIDKEYVALPRMGEELNVWHWPRKK